jgi:type I restriction enzyme, S subunit
MSRFKTKTIEEVTKAIIDYRGKTPPKVEGGIKLITAKVIKDGFIKEERSEYISEETYNSWMRRGYPKLFDVLLTTEAPLGEVAQIRKLEKIALAQRVILLRGNPNVIDHQYFFQSLKSPFVKAGLYQRATGTTVLGIKQSELRQVAIPFHPLPTQRKIASILSAYDDLIENNQRRIKILEEMAQNLYREWFVKFRFPGHEYVRFVDSPLGRIPEGWEVVKLGNLINIRKGKSITKKSVIHGSVPVVAGGINPAYYHNTANTRQPVITISASGANAGYVRLYHENVWSSDCSVIDIETTPYVYFFYLQLKDRHVEVTRLQRGAAQPHVYPKDLMGLDAIKVPYLILDSFTEEVSPIISMIRNLVLKNDILHRTRDLLLPKLISGEVDVSELDVTIPEEN